MAQGRRVERIAALIRKEMSDLLISSIRDERINQGIVTITEVEVAGDLQHCKIHISVLGEQKQKDFVMEGLQDAAGFLRGELARKLQMRRAPELVFQLDNGIEKGISVLNLLGKLKDERRSKSRSIQENID